MSAVVQLKQSLDAVVQHFNREPIQAQPPASWAEAFGKAVKDHLLQILEEELELFVRGTCENVTRHVQDDERPPLQDTPLTDGTVLSQRYKCAGGARSQAHTARGACGDVLDPSLPARTRQVIEAFHSSLCRVLESLMTVRETALTAATGEEHVVSVLVNALRKMHQIVHDVAAEGHSLHPHTGLLVQGLARTVAHVVGRYRKANPWLAPTLFEDFHADMHVTYESAFWSWVVATAEALRADVEAALGQEYWGPDKAVFEKINWASWEHREEEADASGSGGAGVIPSHLPSGPSAALLASLQASCAKVSRVVPSLMRRDVLASLHREVARLVFPLYGQLLEQEEAPVCQPAMWQLLLDVKLLGVVCGVGEHGCAEYDRVVSALLDAERGIDPVYWNTDKEAFAKVFNASLDGVSLLLATHGVKRQPGLPKAQREACYVDFVVECERFPTLHLAPLTPQATQYKGYQSAMAKTPAPAAAADTAAKSATTLAGLQHLQALGTGLQQQWKGMKYFNWT
eukprot:Rhum_TRINITY_DN12394_c0_g1::Rhum_TRINITY_DN12394_c0_g1_i2::g.51518::m.51518